MGLSGKCGPLGGTNGRDMMFPDVLKIVRTVMKGVTRGPARTMPCGQIREGTCGKTCGRRPHICD